MYYNKKGKSRHVVVQEYQIEKNPTDSKVKYGFKFGRVVYAFSVKCDSSAIKAIEYVRE